MSDKAKCNKYLYLAVLQGNYGYGWDDLATYDLNDPTEMGELRSDRRDHRENEPQFAHRVIRRRVLNTQYF